MEKQNHISRYNEFRYFAIAYFSKNTHRQVVVDTIAPPIRGAAPAEMPKPAGIIIWTMVLALPGISVAMPKVRVNKPAPPTP